MPRRVAKVAGAVVAILGFVVAVGSLAAPWATYRVRGTAVDTPVSDSGDVSVLAVPGGDGYLLAVLVLIGLVALATGTGGGALTAVLTATPIAGALTLFLVI